MTDSAAQLTFRQVLAIPSVRRLWIAQLISVFGDFLAVVFVPAQSVALRTFIPREGLMAANALLAQAAQFMLIVSPALAGLLVQWIGADSCFVIDSVSFFFSAGLVLSLDIRRAPITAQHAARVVLHSVGQGVMFIFTHPTISFVVIAMTAGMFAMRSFGALLSVYVRDILASTTAAFGALNSLIGVGKICGSLTLPRPARTGGPQALVLTGLCGMSVAVLLATAFGVMLAVAVAMLTLGLFAGFVMIPAQTLLQRETPQEMLGRVSSSFSPCSPSPRFSPCSALVRSPRRQASATSTTRAVSCSSQSPPSASSFSGRSEPAKTGT